MKQRKWYQCDALNERINQLQIANLKSESMKVSCTFIQFFNISFIHFVCKSTNISSKEPTVERSKIKTLFSSDLRISKQCKIASSTKQQFQTYFDFTGYNFISTDNLDSDLIWSASPWCSFFACYRMKRIRTIVRNHHRCRRIPKNPISFLLLWISRPKVPRK